MLKVMDSNFFKFSSKRQRIKFPTITFIAIGYVITGLLLFKYYNQKTIDAKSLFLDSNYKLILETSLNKLQSLASKLNIDLQASNIFLHDDSIEICRDKNCLELNLLKFQFLLEKSIPNFNKFKVDLNNTSLYSSATSENYEIEKIYYLNQDNKLLISVRVDNNYWNQIAKDIMKPFWFIIVFLSFSFIALCCVLNKASLRKYDREYQNKYDIAVKNHDIAIKNSEGVRKIV